MMKKMVEQWHLETRGCLDTSSFKDKIIAKIEKNRAGSRKVAKEKRKPGVEGTHGCACKVARPCHHHHGLAVLGSAWSRSLASRTPRFVLVLVCVLCLCWVILGVFCYLF